MSDKLQELKIAAIEAESVLENLKTELTQLESAEEVDAAAVKAKKTEIVKATATYDKAVKAIGKEEAKAQKEAEREAKKAEREAEKENKRKEREAKKAEREAAKEAKKAEREANRMPEQNGIVRPRPNTKCGQAWAIADQLSEEFGQPTPIKELLDATNKHGLNEGNVKAEYARWRKFHGITGRVTLPKTEPAETEASTESDEK